MAKSIRDFEGLYGKGELGRRNPEDLPHRMTAPGIPGNYGEYGWSPPTDGFQAQVVTGTARATGEGWNGDRWVDDSPQLPPSPTRPAGRSNRTGE